MSSFVCFMFIYLYLKVQAAKGQDFPGSIAIVIKDDGIDDLKKGDVAMIFYITVTNVSPKKEAIHLFVNSTRCCQQFSDDDTDCESMHLHGGDMGDLKHTHTRNLTLIYANLYLHDRKGSCDIEIRDGANNVMSKNVRFNTMLTKDGPIPKIMEQYYDIKEVMSCPGVDQNPLKECKPYECEIRYSGFRNYFDASKGVCMPVPKCISDGMAYIVETNTCRKLVDEMTDFSEFHGGKPSVRTLSHAHGYPINVQCNNGHRDPSGGRWCSCYPGWASAPFDHASFDPDLQVYHMCTVWMGGVVTNGTIPPPKKNTSHRITTIIVFSMLGAFFLLLCCVLCWLLCKQTRVKKRYGRETETMRLTTFYTDDSD